MRSQADVTGANSLPRDENREVLRAANIVHRINAQLTLQVATFAVKPGEFVAILGPNGAGKTTLLNVLAGGLKAGQGTVSLAGQRLQDLPAPVLAARRAVVRAVSDGLASGLTVREVIELGALSQRLSLRLLHTLTMTYARALDLDARLDADFAVLSSGEKQRVHFARALLQAYGREAGFLLLLDEPFAHLDARHAQAVTREIMRLKQAGAAIICILHDINYAAHHADRVMFMKQAGIAAELPAKDIMNKTLLETIYETPFAILRQGKRIYAIPKNY